MIACISLAVGNFGALVQTNVKRLLAYSSISQAGFMLIPIAANNALGGRALLYYLAVYSAMSIGAFAVVAARERELQRDVTVSDLTGMLWERPVLAISMVFFMLGFAGLPLTGGFFAKFYAFDAAYQTGWWWLMLVGVAATVVSLYYYLAVIRAMWGSPAELQFGPPRPRAARRRATSCSTSRSSARSVSRSRSFFFVQPIIDVARDAASSLPFRLPSGSTLDRGGLTRWQTSR